MEKRYNKPYLSEINRNNIKKYRKEKNLTQQELADLTELSHGYIRDLECPSRNKTPKVETLGTLANALDIEVSALFDEKEKKS